MKFLDFRKPCQYFMDDENWCKRDDHECIEDKCQLYVTYLRHKLGNYERALIKIVEYPFAMGVEIRKIAVDVMNLFSERKIK